ncbi:hypothetical protein [Niallia sp. FSL W8-0954]
MIFSQIVNNGGGFSTMGAGEWDNDQAELFVNIYSYVIGIDKKSY